MSDKTVTIVETTNSAVIGQVTIEVVSVGTQGPAGPNTISGKDLPSTTPSDGDLLRYNATSDEWEFTQEIDAGTY
jgi:hypothetical protein